MKIALLFSGQFRNSYLSSEQLIQWFKNQNNIKQVDVYVHLWWSKEYVGKKYRLDFDTVVEDDPTNNIIKYLKPKKILIEPHDIPSFQDLPYKTEAGGTPEQRESGYLAMMCQFESLKRCLLLISEEYDCLIRVRPDLELSDFNIKWNLTKTLLETNNIYVSDGKFFTGWPLGDWMFAGNQKNITLFILNLKNSYINYAKKIGKQPHIHNYMTAILKSLNLNCESWHTFIKIKRNQMIKTLDSSIKPYWWNWIDNNRLKISTD